MRSVLGLLLLLTACRIGTDLVTEDAGALEAREADGISAALVKAALEPTVFSEHQTVFYHSHNSIGRHAHPVTGPYAHDVEIVDGPLPSHHNLFTVDFAVDVPCGGGGALLLEAAATGEGNPLVQAGRVDYSLGQDPNGCVLLLSEADGARIALESPPYVTGETHVTYDGASTAEISGALTGGVAWEAEAKAGQCELSLTFEATGSTVLGITEVPVAGTFCDLPVDISVVFDR